MIHIIKVNGRLVSLIEILKYGVFIFEGLEPGFYRATPDIAASGQWANEVVVYDNKKTRISFVGIFGIQPEELKG